MLRKQILLQLSACQSSFLLLFPASNGPIMKVIISLKIFINFKSCFEELVLQIIDYQTKNQMKSARLNLQIHNS
jgi:hypothetical protein